MKDRWEECYNSDDCRIDAACRKSDKNASKGRCLSLNQCVLAADMDKTIAENSCKPIDALTRSSYIGCTHSAQCEPGRDCRKSDKNASAGRCLTRVECENATRTDGTQSYWNCAPVEYWAGCTDQQNCGTSGELQCRITGNHGDENVTGRCASEPMCRGAERDDRTTSPYNCEAVVCSDRVLNNTPRAGEGGDGTCASIGNDQARCDTSTDINGIACRYRNGQCEKDPQQRHPCKLLKGLTIYENYGDYRYELEGDRAPKNSRGVFVSSKPGLYTFPEWRGARSLKVSEGYQVCLWREDNGSGDSRIPNGYCRTGRSGGSQFQTTDYEWDMKSFTLKKDCSVPSMVWDPDCDSVHPNKIVSGTSCSDKNSSCYKQRKEYCNRPGAKDQVEDKCVEFCRDNNGECDDVMTSYCAMAEHKDKSACNCINSPARTEGRNYNPLCIDRKCTTSGYATRNMLARECPNVVDCSVYNDLGMNSGSIEFSDMNIQQRCGNEASSSSSAPSVPSSSSFTSPSTPSRNTVSQSQSQSQSQSSSWSILKIIIAILIVVQIGALVIFMDNGIATISILIVTIIASIIGMFIV